MGYGFTDPYRTVTTGQFLGMPVTDETATRDGVGRYNHSAAGPGGHGSIYWTATTAAHEVHGEIRRHWAKLGFERGVLGYPVGDETAVTCRHRPVRRGLELTELTPAVGPARTRPGARSATTG
jgi:uncharacterized protein with LGFP repeats